MVVAGAEIVRAQARINQIVAALIFLTFLHRRMARELPLFESNIVVTFTNPQERVTAAINRETPPPRTTKRFASSRCASATKYRSIGEILVQRNEARLFSSCRNPLREQSRAPPIHAFFPRFRSLEGLESG